MVPHRARSGVQAPAALDKSGRGCLAGSCPSREPYDSTSELIANRRRSSNMGYLANSTSQRAYEAAWSLGHDWLGPEHLLLALVASPSICGDALRASGIEYEQLRRDIDALPARYHGSRRAGSDTERRPLWIWPPAQQLIARAEGIAVGLGSAKILEAHLLLALLWERQTCVAMSLLKQRGIARERILEELGRRGVRLPDVPLPRLPAWGPFTPVSEDEYIPLLGNLRRAGRLYRTAFREGQHYVSIAQAPQHAEARR